VYQLKTALTIAGFDPTCGAGLAADLRTFSAFGFYGLAIASAITAQNSQGVQDLAPVSPGLISRQLASVLADYKPRAIKIGMLANSAGIKAVADGLGKMEIAYLVVDPVMKAHRGGQLMPPQSITTLKERLLPLATLVTPNIYEAERLTGLRLSSISQLEVAARQLNAECRCAVLIKGWQTADSVLDILYLADELSHFQLPRLDKADVHGTGCALSAALAASLALGNPLSDAVRIAKEYVWKGIDKALPDARGMFIFNHFA
jgi:hydroxymethylpyrimidine/phosphomethylpyrimidine kinase